MKMMTAHETALIGKIAVAGTTDIVWVALNAAVGAAGRSLCRLGTIGDEGGKRGHYFGEFLIALCGVIEGSGKSIALKLQNGINIGGGLEFLGKLL